MSDATGMPRSRRSPHLAAFALLAVCVQAAAQSAPTQSNPTQSAPIQSNPTQPAPAPPAGPALKARPAPRPGEVSAGSLRFDVLVTDAAGAPVGGLRQQDFSLLDNGQPITPASFEASDGPTRADPPVEVILLLDETNNLLRNISYEQTDLMRFLRQNGGRLACPTTIMLFTEHGVQTEPHATTDGNALAADLGKTSAPVHMIPLSGGYEAIQRLQQSLRALSLIATAESSRPGRKLLIWIGPGWPLLESAAFQQSQQSQRADFNLLVDLTRRLQEARITLYQVNRLDPSSGLMFLRERYRSYLQPAASPRDFQMAALSLPVFVVHSGGLVQDTPGDFIAMLNRCIAEAQPYYTVRFNPTAAKQDSEYHAVTVRLSRPGLSARTWAGYYADPAPPH